MSQYPIIQIEALIDAPKALVWEAYNDPSHVVKWNAASDDWFCPAASNEVKDGGRFNYRMEARDGSFGFDFTGTYVRVYPGESLRYKLDDDRNVGVDFVDHGDGVRLVVRFEPEHENSLELQREGWQAILNRFKAYAESLVN
jgi:uncharacterized protein YndB with AHSA1/START domain